MAASCWRLLVYLSTICFIKPSVTHEWMHKTCPEEHHSKGIVFSLFGTIRAINQIKQEGLYDVDYSLAFGTLIAFYRNNTLLPWDNDSDLVLIFKNDLNQTELEQFRVVLEQKLRDVLNTPEQGKAKWTFKSKHEQVERHTLWVRAVNGSEGMVDIFLLWHGDTAGKLTMWHPLKRMHEANKPVHLNGSLWLPLQHDVPWRAYGGFKVNIPKNGDLLLQDWYGEDWLIPNVGPEKLNCPKLNKSTLDQWMRQIRGDEVKLEQSTTATAIDQNSDGAEIVVSLDDDMHGNSLNLPFTWYQYAWQLMLYCTVIGLFCRMR